MEETLDVHLGSVPPDQWDATEKQQARVAAARRQKRPAVATEQIPWTELGFTPRWVGDDTSRAVAALEPSRYSHNGADELGRFLAGARQREELALLITTISRTDNRPATTHNVFERGDANVGLARVDDFSVRGTRIRLSRPPTIADGLSNVDRDLAQRIARRPVDGPWWDLDILTHQIDRHDPRRPPHMPRIALLEPFLSEPQEDPFYGTWTPLLETPAGEVVAAVWTDHEDGDQDPPLVRHYVLPAPVSYVPVLRWIAERAVPEFIPTAARRTRRYAADQPELLTRQEQDVLARLDTLRHDYEQQHAQLTDELTAARDRAGQVRDPLLFGAGKQLEEAVAIVLRDAGMTVTELDPLLGTKSADILVELAGRRVLVEVKSSSGNAPEDLTAAVRRHLQTWPHLQPDVDVDGIGLVVNHQHRLPPADRTPQVFTRREFVATLEFPVISTVQLFDWWRTDQFSAIRQALGFPGAPTMPPPASEPATPKTRRSRWRRGS